LKYIDLRSDTVTQPTKAMREAMFNAEVGDDVYEDDPTVKELEEYAASLVGKEASLFVPSGTFGNQLAIFTHCRHGDEVILDEECHIMAHEVGAASVIAGVQLRNIRTDKGIPDPSEILRKIREDDIHEPSTGLICMENAHSNGRVIPIAIMKEVYSVSQKHHIPLHLDGARVFNAAAYLGVEVTSITQYCDSVMFCLSKGLCAPIGSILAGSKEFILKARKGRKLMGGGMRQVGILAAAGIVALKEIRPELYKDHEKARLLGEKLSLIPGIKVFQDDIHINMVYFDMSETRFDSEILAKELFNKGIKINTGTDGLMRFVTHHWIKNEDISIIVDSIKEIISKI